MRLDGMQSVATAFAWDLLLDDGLDQVSWPVDIDAAADRQRVGQQWKRHDLEDGGQKVIACRNEETGIAIARNFAVTFSCQGDDPRSLLPHIFHELKHLRIT